MSVPIGTTRFVLLMAVATLASGVGNVVLRYLSDQDVISDLTKGVILLIVNALFFLPLLYIWQLTFASRRHRLLVQTACSLILIALVINCLEEIEPIRHWPVFRHDALTQAIENLCVYAAWFNLVLALYLSQVSLVEVQYALQTRFDEQASELTESNRHLKAEITQRRQSDEEARLAKERADREVKASREQFNQLANSIQDVFYLLDLEEQRVLYLSPAYEEIWGRPRSNLYEDLYAWQEGIHPDDRDGVSADFARMLADDPDYDKVSEYRVVRPDETVCWVRRRGFPIYDSAGKMVRIAAVITDITARKEAELALRQINEELEVRVDERTRELSVAVEELEREIEQRTHAQQTLAHVSRISTMGEMATGLAHELNQPLAGIATYAASAKRRMTKWKEDEPGNEGLQIAHDELEHLQSVLTKIDAQAQRAGGIIHHLKRLVGPLGPPRASFSINQAVTEGVSFIEFQAKSRDVEIGLELDDACPPVFGDSVQIQQVVLNLVLNAIEVLDGRNADQRWINIATSRGTDEFVQVRVFDSGPGIPFESRESLFDTFFTTKKKGLGLGLSISRTIVEGHGGTLWESNDDSTPGADFRFTLPLAKPKGIAREPASIAPDAH